MVSEPPSVIGSSLKHTLHEVTLHPWASVQCFFFQFRQATLNFVLLVSFDVCCVLISTTNDIFPQIVINIKYVECPI